MKLALHTPGEVVTSYRQALDQRKQVGILSELNRCTREEIVTLLEAAGEDMEWYRSRKTRRREKPPHIRWTREERDLLREKLQQGYSIEEVAGILGRTESSAYHQAYNYGFLPQNAGEVYRNKKREKEKGENGKHGTKGKGPAGCRRTSPKGK